MVSDSAPIEVLITFWQVRVPRENLASPPPEVATSDILPKYTLEALHEHGLHQRSMTSKGSKKNRVRHLHPAPLFIRTRAIASDRLRMSDDGKHMLPDESYAVACSGPLRLTWSSAVSKSLLHALPTVILRWDTVPTCGRHVTSSNGRTREPTARTHEETKWRRTRARGPHS